MPHFETLDISGDAGIRAFGDNLEELFVNAAMGMYSLITDADAVKEIRAVEIYLESRSLDSLLISWLNELIFQFDTYGFIGKKIAITEFSPRQNAQAGEQFSVKATLSGEDFDPSRHERRLLVKAATYHKLRVQETGGTWETEVIFDI
jgi:SHS2 domain-containing protein